jgi:hypothetical protein
MDRKRHVEYQRVLTIGVGVVNVTKRLLQTGAMSVLLLVGAACGPHAGAHQDAAPSAPARSTAGSQRLDHLSPARDSVGVAPKTFTWTAVPGADSYSIGVWNEIDMIVWRQNNIPGTSVTRPDDVPLEPGTYFWSVSALRNGEELADSGLSAFVVRTSP